ncbi:hypothetical protein [Rhodococcus daqingensis]|uniref:DUF998 domain-containing protein n=1 Tax=Rhodococcus daqingensis TaxID=2479363 RepID=A0ABW2RXM3_9NOCA
MADFDRTKSVTRATLVAIAPVVLFAAMIWHPYIAGRLPDHHAIAEAVTDDPTRWGLAHLAAAVAAAALILAFIAIRGVLREAGDKAWSAIGLGLIVIGSVAYAVLPGMEFAPFAAVESGADPEAAQAALDAWFVPVLFVGAFTFAIGVLCVGVALRRYGAMNPTLGWIVVGALIVMAASRFVPFAAVQFYVQSAAALIALWPLAWVVWTRRGHAISQSESP